MDRSIFEKEILKNNKKDLDNAPINSMTPVRNQLEEIYFITKARPSLIKELVEEKRNDNLPKKLKASISSYIENKDTVIFRMDFLNYPFYFETEFYPQAYQKEYVLQMLNQDKFALFFITEDRTGNRKVITEKMFNLHKAMLSGFKKYAKKMEWI